MDMRKILDWIGEAEIGDIAQLGEHRTCNAKVVGAEPTISTSSEMGR